MGLHKSVLLSNLRHSIQAVSKNKVSRPRTEILQPLIGYIQGKIDSKEAINLHFICTHNSRRSQLAQIWAQTMAYYFDIEIHSFSGGTVATAFNERAVEAIVRVGFEVQKNEHPDNPIYQVFYVKGRSPLLIFSKLVDDPVNPTANFAAIMTCSDADENCPIVHGAEARIAIRYEDPKAYDNTPQEAQMYDGRSVQIATEMYYVFSQIKSRPKHAHKT